MAKKDEFLTGLNDEYEVSEIVDEVAGEQAAETPGTPAEPVAEGGTPSEETTTTQTTPTFTEKTETEETTPAAETPAATETPEVQTTPAPVVDGGGILLMKEIFGDKYATIDDLKADDVLGKLTEIDSLRQKNQDLETQLKGPVGFANDKMALFNEFVKETGIESFGVFDKLMNTDLNNLNALDGLVLKRVMDNPKLIGREADVKAMFEKNYGLNSEEVEESELKLNQLTMEGDSVQAIKSLREMKEGIKMPEKQEPVEQPAAGPTPQQVEALQKGWGDVVNSMNEHWKTVAIPIEGATEPYMDYEVPAEAKEAMVQDTVKYCVDNHMELSQENANKVFVDMYDNFILRNLSKIVHAATEKAKTATAEKVEEDLHNPSALSPDTPGTPSEEEDSNVEKAYKAEMEG